MSALDDALAPYGELEQGGFVVFLFRCAGGDVPLSPALERVLVRFLREAGVDPSQTPEEQEARIEALYARVPIPAPLRALFERELQTHSAAQDDDTRRAASLLGRGGTARPVGGPRPKNAFGGGALAAIAARLAAKKP